MKNRKSNQPGKKCRNKACKNKGGKNRNGKVDCAAVKILVNLFTGRKRNRKNCVGVGTKKHKTCLTKAEEACKTVQKVHGNRNKCVNCTFFKHGKKNVGRRNKDFQNCNQGKKKDKKSPADYLIFFVFKTYFFHFDFLPSY